MRARMYWMHAAAFLSPLPQQYQAWKQGGPRRAHRGLSSYEPTMPATTLTLPHARAHACLHMHACARTLACTHTHTRTHTRTHLSSGRLYCLPGSRWQCRTCWWWHLEPRWSLCMMRWWMRWSGGAGRHCPAVSPAPAAGLPPHDCSAVVCDPAGQHHTGHSMQACAADLSAAGNVHVSMGAAWGPAHARSSHMHVVLLFAAL